MVFIRLFFEPPFLADYLRTGRITEAEFDWVDVCYWLLRCERPARFDYEAMNCL